MKRDIIIVAIIITLLLSISFTEDQRNRCESLCESEGYDLVHSCSWFNIHCKKTVAIDFLGNNKNISYFGAYYNLNGEWVAYQYFQDWED